MSLKDKSTETDPIEAFMAPPPAVSALYESLPAATPDKLRGVWRSKETNSDGADVRFRFRAGQIVGGARCGDLLTGTEHDIELKALDSRSGSLDLDFGFSFSRSTGDGRSCGGRLPGGVWSFVVEGKRLTLTSSTQDDAYEFEKLGD